MFQRIFLLGSHVESSFSELENVERKHQFQSIFLKFHCAEFFSTFSRSASSLMQAIKKLKKASSLFRQSWGQQEKKTSFWQNYFQGSLFWQLSMSLGRIEKREKEADNSLTQLCSRAASFQLQFVLPYQLIRNWKKKGENKNLQNKPGQNAWLCF